MNSFQISNNKGSTPLGAMYNFFNGQNHRGTNFSDSI